MTNNNSVRFLHFRDVWDINDFDDLSEKPQIEGKGGATVAYRQEPNGSFSYAIAVCSERDNFNRRIGRDISLGRLVKGPAATVPENVIAGWAGHTGDDSRLDLGFELYMDELMFDKAGLRRVRRGKRKPKACDNQIECCCDCG